MPDRDLSRELREAARRLDGPRARTPRRPRDGHVHEYIESDRCHWCGEPQPTIPPLPLPPGVVPDETS